MANQIFLEEDLVLEIHALIYSKGSQKAVAKHLEISEQYLTDILKARRNISAEIAEKLGYSRRVCFFKKRT